MKKKLLDILDGVETTPVLAPEGAELMYRPSEGVFANVAKTLVQNGWSVFPQDAERRPGRVGTETIKWQKEHDLENQLPKPEALDSWVMHCGTLNAAAVMGPASGYSFAIDIDVLDEDLSIKISALADAVLGYTPLRRVGKAPKLALIYRYDPSDPISKISRHFSETNAEGQVVPSENAIEILGKGTPLTFIGKHHKTGRYFQWLDASPLTSTPEVAPVVKAWQIKDFMERIDNEVCRFHRGNSFIVPAEHIDWDDEVRGKISSVRSAAGGMPWVEDESGKVINGRESFMTNLVWRVVSQNYHANNNHDDLTRAVVREFSEKAALTGRWNLGYVHNTAKQKVGILLEKAKDKKIMFRSHQENEEVFGNSNRLVMPYDKEQLKSRNLEFLPDQNRRIPIRGKIVGQTDAYSKTEEERQKEINDIQVNLRNALDEFFEDVFAANCGHEPEEACVHVVKAPTGAGKTSQTIRYIGEMKAAHWDRARRERQSCMRDVDGNIIVPAQGLELTYTDEAGRQKNGRMPIVFLLPTYANIEEVRVRAEILNLDAGLSDEELKAAAAERGIVAEADLEARLSDLKRDAMNAGLDVMVYKGKIAAGCQMSDKVSLAMQSGLGTASFCKASYKNDNGQNETVYCPHYSNCPAIRQKEMIQDHDLIFTPHPFMQLDIPDALKHVRAVIADERIHHLFLHTTEFPLQTLLLPRRGVKLTAQERGEGLTEHDFMASRTEAVKIVIDAFKSNACPAQALFVHETKQGVTGAQLVADCIRICTNALQKDAKITPNTPLDEIKKLCAQPTGLNLREEHQFWKIIQERISMLTHDSLMETANEHAHDAEKKDIKLLAKGRKDMRLQYIREHVSAGNIKEAIRISWRTQPNWNQVPLLLLDASAEPNIIQKIWGGIRVKTHDISGPLNVRVVGVVNRTFSNATVVGSVSDPEDVRVLTAKRLNQLRTALSMVSSLYGWGRVVAGGSILVRKAFNMNWAGPDNVDWCHFGAMRGLDFAKHHSAAFSVGRMELPLRTIDGLVAALTYDDETPEEPYDRDGTGLVPETNQTLMMPTGYQKFTMRSGEIVEIPAPLFPENSWARRIQEQYREEELLQFVGRLRPVYREGEPPVWFACSSVIPQNLTIDDLIHIDDLTSGPSYLFDAIRRAEGVVHPELLHAAAPDLFPSKENIPNIMSRYGFDSTTGVKNNRYTFGFSVFEVYFENTHRMEYVYVRSSHADPESVIKRVFADNNIPVSSVIAYDTSRPYTLARPRVPDGIDIMLGTSEERKTKEQKNSEATELKIFMEDFKRKDMSIAGFSAHPVTFSAGESEALKNLFITYSDMEVTQTLRDLWNQIIHEKGINIKNPVIADNDDNYEKLGNHVDDVDTLRLPNF